MISGCQVTASLSKKAAGEGDLYKFAARPNHSESGLDVSNVN